MRRKKDNLDLKYLNNRIDTLTKKFNKFEDTCYFWKNEDRKEMDNLKQQIQNIKELSK